MSMSYFTKEKAYTLYRVFREKAKHEATKRSLARKEGDKVGVEIHGAHIELYREVASEIAKEFKLTFET